MIVRVAVNVEQLLHEAPGGIGRYTAELLRLLPALRRRRDRRSPPVTRVPTSTRALHAQGLDGLDPVILPLPAAVLYDAWHVLGVAGPARRRRAGRPRARAVAGGAADAAACRSS